MARIPRVTMVPFGNNAGAVPGGIGVFGSLAAGTPTESINIATIMAASAWSNGWGSALVNLFPAQEDLNSPDFVHSQQIAEILQDGIPPYDAGTTYYINSIVQVSGQLYISLVDGNIGNTPASSPSNWALQDPGLLVYGGVIGVESTSTQLNLTIPGFPSNSNIPIGTVLEIFVGAARQTIIGGCVISINGGTGIAIGPYDNKAFSSLITVQLASQIQFKYNGSIWELLFNPQNDGFLSPSSAISGTVNNYAPTGFVASISNFLSFNLSGDTTLTGLAEAALTTPANGAEVILYNNSVHNLIIAHISGSSTLGNQFSIYNSTNLTIPANGFAKARYSRGNQLWYVSI